MSNSVTVVISSAGQGRRLNFGVPKSLVKVSGKTLIEWQLQQLDEFKDIVVVVGFKAKELARHVWTIRPDAKIAINHDFASTGTAASMAIGAKIASDRVFGLDGDVLISNSTLDKFMQSQKNLLGVMPLQSKKSHPVLIKDDHIVEFDTNIPTNWEWTGPFMLERKIVLELGSAHVYQGLKSLLPLRSLVVDGVELDYVEDLPEVERWIGEQNQFR